MGTTVSTEEDVRYASNLHKSDGAGGAVRAIPSMKSTEEEEAECVMTQASTLSGDDRNDRYSGKGGGGGGPIVGSVVGADSSSGGVIQDDDVNVNLAMADLMVYLQMVANNSQNLPLTRRDDPELGKTVSTLTAEDYSRKSAAFFPSDVRIIGGSFTKYGRVQELPSSEDYTPADGAQEPGKSTGGACCNALLKVLYDAENDAADVMAQSEFVNPDTLFEDDDDDEGGVAVTASMPSKSFDMSLPDMTQMSTITWANLLRKMKAEIQSIGYAQMPTITASRKFDLGKPFSLVPTDFDPTKNKKRSLLIGCNYSDTTDGFSAEIKASHDDIRSVKDFIVNVHGFPETRGLMTVLMDDGEHQAPTHNNITEAFKALSEESQPGDAVFVQFVGHGGRILDSSINADGENPYDELIVPSDHKDSGFIRDTLIFKTLLAPMRQGVTVTMLIDCCDTGMVLDLPYSWSTKNDKPDSMAMPKMTVDEDFSFVRFLKVVKSLYEASTFTQLGKTVRTVLRENPYAEDEDHEEGESILDDDDTLGGGSLETVDEDEEKKTKAKAAATNALSAFASCYTPRNVDITKKDMKYYDPSQDKPSLLEKVMTCTLNHEEGILSDDEEGMRGDDRTYDQTLGQSDSLTFDDGTIEESLPERKKQGRSRSGRDRTRR